MPYLDRQACLQHIDETTFRLQPSDYRQKYPKWAGLVGLEIEMQPVAPERPLADGRPGHVRLQGQSNSIAAVLRQMAADKQWRISETKDDHGQPLLLSIHMEQDDQISFEPGGQIEFSSKPYPCLSEAVRRMRNVQDLLEATLRPHGIELVQIGVNPWHKVAEIGLQMAKGRYRAMDQYFSAIGEYGPRMMRQSCTVQVNLDFGPDPQTLAQRYLASMLLAPIVAATFAYSPYVDNQDAGILSFRTRIWRDVDRLRTGLPGLQRMVREQSRQAAVESYLEFALAAPVIFVADLNYQTPKKTTTFGEWLEHPIEGVRPTLDDFKTHLTLLFPEVRPRGFLELRSIDCQPRAFQSVPASYYSALLYDEKTLMRVLDELTPRAEQLEQLLHEATRGLQHPELKKLAQLIMDLAVDAFSRFSPCYTADGCQAQLLAFRERFTAQGITPADELAAACRKNGTMTVALLRRLEDTWAQAAANHN